jgi:hypothetical protein
MYEANTNTGAEYLINSYFMEECPSLEANSLSVSQKFFTFYGTRTFITVCSLPAGPMLREINPVHSSFFVALRSILILSYHIHPGLPASTDYTAAQHPRRQQSSYWFLDASNQKTSVLPHQFSAAIPTSNIVHTHIVGSVCVSKSGHL